MVCTDAIESNVHKSICRVQLGAFNFACSGSIKNLYLLTDRTETEAVSDSFGDSQVLKKGKHHILQRQFKRDHVCFSNTDLPFVKCVQ